PPPAPPAAAPPGPEEARPLPLVEPDLAFGSGLEQVVAASAELALQAGDERERLVGQDLVEPGVGGAGAGARRTRAAGRRRTRAPRRSGSRRTGVRRDRGPRRRRDGSHLPPIRSRAVRHARAMWFCGPRPHPRATR